MSMSEASKQTHIKLDDGDVVIMTLTRQGQKQTITDKLSYAHLMDLGLSTSWYESAARYVSAVANKAKGNLIYVARDLLDTGVGQNIQYLDSNPLNLRRSNLQLTKDGWATKRDCEFLLPPLIWGNGGRPHHAA